MGLFAEEASWDSPVQVLESINIRGVLLEVVGVEIFLDDAGEWLPNLWLLVYDRAESSTLQHKSLRADPNTGSGSINYFLWKW